MKKKLLIIPSILALFSLASCNPTNEGVGGSHSIVDILLNASDGYTFENGKSSTYLHVHKNVTWGAVKDSAPKKVKDLNGNYFDIPSTDKAGNPKNYWIVDGQTTAISDNYVFNADTTTLNAHIVPSQQITITLNPGAGTWKSGPSKGESITRTYTSEQGTIWSTIANDFLIDPPSNKVFVGFSKTEDGEAIPGTYEFNENTTLYAKYINSGTFTNFNTDPWPVVSQALTSLDALKTAYGKTTFIGEKRSVTLWGVDYEVVVIGENVDTIYKTENKATLTFQFVDAIETGIGFNNSAYNLYDTAAIRGYLNQSLINQLPEAVKNNIQIVEKRAANIEEVEVKKYPEKIFLPSFNEVGITSFKVGDLTIDCLEEGFYDEGTEMYNKPYEYYSNSSTAPTRRIKKYYENPSTHTGGAAVDYWLRSVDYESDDSVYYIMSTGVAPTEGSFEADIGLAIAPCFALGGNA